MAATKIILKSGAGVPQTTDLEPAELALDSTNGNLYTYLLNGQVVEIGGDKLWESNGNNIHYTLGEVGIGGESEGDLLSVYGSPGDTLLRMRGKASGNTGLYVSSYTANAVQAAGIDYNVGTASGQHRFSMDGYTAALFHQQGFDFLFDFEGSVTATEFIGDGSKLSGVVGKDYVDEHTQFTVVDTTNFVCSPNKNYVFTGVSVNNPTINLPVLTGTDLGEYVTIADGDGVWGDTGKHLTVNLNGTLYGQAIGQLTLDISNVTVTFIWNGNDWSVHSSMAAIDSSGGSNPWTDSADGIAYAGRIDTASVHTGELEADYLLGTPRRHYEAVFGRSVPLDEELNSLEKRSVRHGAGIENLERDLQEFKADRINKPVVPEAVYDGNTYARKDGEWVLVESGIDDSFWNNTLYARMNGQWWPVQQFFATNEVVGDNQDRIKALELGEVFVPYKGSLRWEDSNYESDTPDVAVSGIKVHNSREKMCLNHDTIDSGRRNWGELIDEYVGIEIDGEMYWAEVEFTGSSGQNSRSKNFKILAHSLPSPGVIAKSTEVKVFPNWNPHSGKSVFKHKYVNTAETQKTTHEGQAAMQFDFYSDKQNTGLNVPVGLELNSIDLDFAYFHGKHPNTATLYNPKVTVIFKDDDGNELKTDILVHKQEFGWGQGFEREFQQREVLVPKGSTKVLVKIDNVDTDASQDTSADWEGKTYYNRIGIEGYWY